jgi:hypothetical protein
MRAVLSASFASVGAVCAGCSLVSQLRFETRGLSRRRAFFAGSFLSFASKLADRLGRTGCKQCEREGHAMRAMHANAGALNRTRSRAYPRMQERFTFLNLSPALPCPGQDCPKLLSALPKGAWDGVPGIPLREACRAYPPDKRRFHSLQSV